MRDALPFARDVAGGARPLSASALVHSSSAVVVPSPIRSRRRPISASESNLRLSTSSSDMLTLLHAAEPAGGAGYINAYRKVYPDQTNARAAIRSTSPPLANATLGPRGELGLLHHSRRLKAASRPTSAVPLSAATDAKSVILYPPPEEEPPRPSTAPAPSAAKPIIAPTYLFKSSCSSTSLPGSPNPVSYTHLTLPTKA